MSTSGGVHCWGCEDQPESDPVDHGQCDPPTGVFQQVATGVYHSCALTVDGEVVCWGCGPKGSATDLGQCDPPTVRMVDIDVGKWHGCGLGVDGAIRCWGDDYFGQLDTPQ